jgi:hypothetical protein
VWLGGLGTLINVTGATLTEKVMSTQATAILTMFRGQLLASSPVFLGTSESQ